MLNRLHEDVELVIVGRFPVLSPGVESYPCNWIDPDELPAFAQVRTVVVEYGFAASYLTAIISPTVAVPTAVVSEHGVNELTLFAHESVPL